MKTIKLIALLSSLFTLHSALAQGPLTPPGPPGPTFKTLTEIEPRTPITNTTAVTIAQSGSYYLTSNITVTNGNAITIAASGVTLDLNGFTLASTEATPTGSGILLNSGLKHITILNGHIRGGVTNSAGTYLGPGFANGISFSGTVPDNVLVSRVSVSGCLTFGIFLLGAGENNAAVESCSVRTVGSHGIGAMIVKQSLAIDCGGFGIAGNLSIDCRGQSTGSGNGVGGTTVLNCYGSSSNGVGVSAHTALNCRGVSRSNTGIGAVTAQNCVGESSSGIGLTANTAQNCYGQSSSSNGLHAPIAIGCAANTFSPTTHQYFCGSGANPYP